MSVWCLLELHLKKRPKNEYKYDPKKLYCSFSLFVEVAGTLSAKQKKLVEWDAIR